MHKKDRKYKKTTKKGEYKKVFICHIEHSTKERKEPHNNPIKKKNIAVKIKA